MLVLYFSDGIWENSVGKADKNFDRQAKQAAKEGTGTLC